MTRFTRFTHHTLLLASLCVSVALPSAAPAQTGATRLGARGAKAETRVVNLSVGPAGWQVGCPVRVHQTMFSSEHVLEYAAIVNRASVDVVSVTLAIVAT
jgi:hypothetical protein